MPTTRFLSRIRTVAGLGLALTVGLGGALHGLAAGPQVTPNSISLSSATLSTHGMAHRDSISLSLGKSRPAGGSISLSSVPVGLSPNSISLS